MNATAKVILKNFFTAMGVLCLLAIAWAFWDTYAPPRLTVDENGVEHLKGPGLRVTYHEGGGTAHITHEHLNMASIKMLQERLQAHPSPPYPEGNTYSSAMWLIDEEAKYYNSYKEMVRARFKRFIFF